MNENNLNYNKALLYKMLKDMVGLKEVPYCFKNYIIEERYFLIRRDFENKRTLYADLEKGQLMVVDTAICNEKFKEYLDHGIIKHEYLKATLKEFIARVYVTSQGHRHSVGEWFYEWGDHFVTKFDNPVVKI